MKEQVICTGKLKDDLCLDFFNLMFSNLIQKVNLLHL